MLTGIGIAVDWEEYRPGSRKGKHAGWVVGTISCQINGFGGLTVAFYSTGEKAAVALFASAP
jgi:hypothetical protein